jgi:hypothetical protein
MAISSRLLSERVNRWRAATLDNISEARSFDLEKLHDFSVSPS